MEKDNLVGDVKFNNVRFVYPSRTDVPVLTGLSLTAAPGQTTALVGTSGCGKVNTRILHKLVKLFIHLEYLYAIITTIL